MKNKYFLLPILAIVVMAIHGAFAADNIQPNSGVVRQLTSMGWNESRLQAVSSNVAVVATSQITTNAPAIVRAIIIVPGSTSDTFTVYTSTVAGQTNANREIFTSNPQKAGIYTIGLPVIYDFPAGLDATNMLSVALTSNGTTTNTTRLFISYRLPQ